MFTSGFEKTANAALVPKTLGSMTGAPAMNTFGRPVRKFGQPGRQALVGLSRLRDGLR